jgi:hypothetical protein
MIAIFDTRNFEFIAHGDDEKHCLALLRAAWLEHCRQYPPADPDYLETYADGVRYLDIKSGEIYRDNSLMFKTGYDL